MSSSPLWARLVISMLVAVMGTSACGGSTGLAGGIPGSAAGPGEAGVTDEPGGSGAGGGTGNGGGVAGDAAGGAAGLGTAGAPHGGQAGTGGAPPGQAVLVSLAVTPAVSSTAVGTQSLFEAIGTYSDNSTKDLSASATWSSSDASIASVNAGVVKGIAPGTVTLTAKVDALSASAKVTVPNASVQSLTVSPATASVGLQGTVAFQAVVTLSDSTTQDVTATATWASGTPAVARVSTTGIATGISAGTSTMSASVGAVSGTAALTVTSATLISIALTPTNPSAGIGVTLPFTATGSFSDGSVADVSSGATFGSSDVKVATVDAQTHAAKTLAAGTTQISAAVGKVSGSSTLTVTAATLTSIAVTPASNLIAVKGQVALKAVGSYSDNTTADVTPSVTWSSNLPGVAAVSNAAGSQGTVLGLSPGSTTVTASLASVSGSAAVTVTSATLVSIAITPATPSLPIGTTQSLTATGTYSDASLIDISASVTWSSETPGVATVSNAASNPGLVRAVALGSAKVHATLSSVSAVTVVTVTAAKLVSISITPANSTLPAGITQALTATANYSDSSSLDVTASAVWSSSAADVVSVSNASGTQGNVTAIKVGTAIITAALSGVTGTAAVTVSAPKLVQITVEPIASSVRVGSTVRYTAVAIYSNNTSQTLMQGVVWSSSNTAAATLANGNMGPGGTAATAVGVGVTTISATYQGVTGTTTLTVTSSTVSQISVTPIAITLPVGGAQQYAATAIYSDNTSQDITAQVTWVSSAPTVAQISTGNGGPGPGGGAGASGRATALVAGTTNIAATWNGVSGSTTLTVTAATLTQVSINPAVASGAVGSQQQFTAQAIFSDNTTRDVTGAATWVSSAPAVVGVNDAGGPGGGKGLAKALAAGSAVISASYDGKTASATYTVTAATLTSIQVTPFAPTVLIGFTTNLVATGIYSDNTTRDLTLLATWVSNAPAVASVSDANASRGLLTPLAAGTATITASYGGATGSDVITVSAATLTGIKVTPATAAIANHTTQAFTALGTLSDAKMIDVTNYVTWLSTTPSIASISNAAGSRGVATGLSTGSVTISAIRGAVTGTASLTVQ